MSKNEDINAYKLIYGKKTSSYAVNTKYQNGGEYDLSDEEVQNLINQGYKIEYLDGKS